MNLTNLQQDLIIGTLLGDAHLQISFNNTGYLTFEQSSKHKEYLYHLYDIMQPFCKYEPKLYVRTDKRYSKNTCSYYFRTLNYFELFQYSEIFLDINNKKKISPKIVNYLNFRVLAY
jgi:hypothetical protein